MTTELEMKQIVMIRECLQKQMEEYELLKSIYSNPGEFQSDNPFLVNDMQDFLDGNRRSVDEKLDYRIKLQLNERVRIELSVILSQYYPSHEQPMFIIRTDSLSKQQEKSVKKAIEDYIETEVDKSEPYVFQIISWLQDNIDEITKVPTETNKSLKEGDEEEKEKEELNQLRRVWLWSHHIYSKIKRQDIMKLSRDYDLNGFMWPGKPGVICFEGTHDNVEEVVKIIKGWQWQKLKIVKTESNHEDQEEFFKFGKFNEILTSEVDGEPMNSGEFLKYLESHNSADMKKELFGLG